MRSAIWFLDKLPKKELSLYQVILYLALLETSDESWVVVETSTAVQPKVKVEQSQKLEVKAIAALKL